MTIEQAIELLRKEYREVKEMGFIKKPLACAVDGDARSTEVRHNVF